jgi:hypothetical protein
MFYDFFPPATGITANAETLLKPSPLGPLNRARPKALVGHQRGPSKT